MIVLLCKTTHHAHLPMHASSSRYDLVLCSHSIPCIHGRLGCGRPHPLVRIQTDLGRVWMIFEMAYRMNPCRQFRHVALMIPPVDDHRIEISFRVSAMWMRLGVDEDVCHCPCWSSWIRWVLDALELAKVTLNCCLSSIYTKLDTTKNIFNRFDKGSLIFWSADCSSLGCWYHRCSRCDGKESTLSSRPISHATRKPWN